MCGYWNELSRLHSLYKWADRFLDGEMRFRSLAYFRDHENESEAVLTNQSLGLPVELGKGEQNA